jgi:hypothetical protein
LMRQRQMLLAAAAAARPPAAAPIQRFPGMIRVTDIMAKI